MAAPKIEFDKVEQPELAKHDSSVLDLAFAMDCTSSMGSYIRQAQQSIRSIVEQIVANEKSNVHLALVEFRDHPPQDSTFVTRPHDFTASVKTMKGWLDACSAQGGGDTPEAVADALHDLLKLSWRPEATKICVLIVDAPPHGLHQSGDGFPDGCPSGIDPVTVVNELTAMGVTLYVVGCEPSVTPSKVFYSAMAYNTGGQYVPLTNAALLAQVIIGGAQEEISLQTLMAEVETEVQQDLDLLGEAADEEEITKRVHTKLKSKGAKSKQLFRNKAALPEVSDMAKKISSFTNMSDLKANYTSEMSASASLGASRPMKMKSAKKKSLFSKGKARMAADTEVEVCNMSLGAVSMDECAADDESYEVEEAEVNMAQAQRMVHKAMVKKKK